MKTILVPTDFSKNAYAALHYATQLFKEEYGKIIILHSFESQVTTQTSRIDIGKTEVVVEELYKSTEAKCEAIKHQIVLDTKNDKHSFQTIVTSMSLSKAINKLIVKEEVDIVVMGSTGTTGASTILMGSTTMRIMRKIRKAPLLIIPKEVNFKPLLKIGFASGFKRTYTQQGLQPLIDLAGKTNAQIKVVHIHEKVKLSDDQRENYHLLFELLKEFRPETNWLSDTTDNYDAITSYLHKEQIDLLAMIYYKHNFMVRLFKEQLIKKIAEHSLIPLLIMPKSK